MVDFSNREDIKRWLDGIEPAKRRREVAVAVAARAALRVVPLVDRVASARERQFATILSDFVLPSLRAIAVAWAAGQFASRGEELGLAAGKAVTALANATVESPVVSAACSAALAVVDQVSASAPAVATAFAASIASANATAYSLNVIADNANAADAALAADAAFVDSGGSGAELVASPLWPDGAPDWATENWRTLKAALLAANEGWEIWTDWYEARLAGDAGHPPNEALEIARATIADEIWRQGPTVVNAEIKRLIEEQSAALGAPEGNASDGSSQDQPNFEPILAIRAALRVVPLLATDTDRASDRNTSRFVLSVFRGLAVAWARTEFPSLVGGGWCVAAAREIPAYAEPSALAPRLVGRASAEAAFSAGSESLVVAGGRALAALSRATEAAAVSHDAALSVIVKQAYARDRVDIVPGVGPEQLGRIELWPGRDPPSLIGQCWDNLKEQLRFADEGWDVWIEWYEARLDGRLRSQEVELAHVNYIRNIAPTASASEANSEIRRLIESASPNLTVPTGTLNLTAGTASYAVGASGSVVRHGFGTPGCVCSGGQG
jgi:hypothetical protein